jgi:hypothetical protein
MVYCFPFYGAKVQTSSVDSGEKFAEGAKKPVKRMFLRKLG